VTEQLTLPGLFGLNDTEAGTNEQAAELRKPSREADAWVYRIVWAIHGPIIVMPGYTDMAVPEPVRNRITFERLLIAGNQMDVGSDAEAMWYLSNASLVSPLDTYWGNIYMHLTRKYVVALGRELPDFLVEERKLDAYMEEQPLRHFKEWLYKKSFEAVKMKAKR